MRMRFYPIAECEHEDYNSFAEFGPEPPEFPDEMRVCGWCEHYSRHSEVSINMGSYRELGAQCLHTNAMCCEAEDGDDILDGRVFVLASGRPCKNFDPSQAALEEAEYGKAENE